MHRIGKLAALPLTLAFAVSAFMATGSASAAEMVTAEEILKKLTANAGQRTRSLKKPRLRIEGVEEVEADDAVGRIDLYITFETASHSLTAAARAQLAQLALALNSEQLLDDEISIVGHTDARGTESYNMALSVRRAAEVRRYLNEKLDVKLSRLTATGKGESQLKDRKSPASEINRRVEIVNMGR